MMTLDEAIAHAKEKAKEIRKANEEMPTDCKLSEELCECAKEHEQLADWLEELKRFKSQKVLIKVKPQDAKTLKKILRSSQFGIAYPDTQYEVVLMVSGGQVDRWISVSERLPDKEGKCLVFTDYGDVTMDSFIDGMFVCNLGNVTHWKPLPKAPESEGST